MQPPCHELLHLMRSQTAKALVVLVVWGWVMPGVMYAQAVAQLDIPYAVVPPGTDPILLSLDVYASLNANNLPIVVWVHGGAWAIGDKSTLFYKADWLTNNDFVLVSVNYRLSPDPPELTNATRIMHPTHAQDVAAAIAFVRQNAAAWGGNPDRIALMGHSAGAHLVSLVATDARFLQAHGMTPFDLSAVVSLDSGAYDVGSRAASSVLETYFLNAFTDDPSVWTDASPITHVTADVALPPFFLVHQTRPQQTNDAEAFAARLNTAGHTVITYPAPGLSHADINQWLGGPEDPIYTRDVLSFLRDAVATTNEPFPTERSNAEGASMMLGPNPARDYVNLSLAAPGIIYTIDLLGRTLAQQEGQGVVQVNLRAYAPGIYVLLIVGESYRHVERIVRVS